MLLFFLTGLLFEIKRIIIAFWAFVKREIENILRNFGMGRYGLPRARCALAMTYFLHGVRFSGPMWASAPTQGGFLCLLESGTGKVCRPPPPQRLEMAIML